MRMLILGLGFYSIFQYHIPLIQEKNFGVTDKILIGKWDVEQQFLNGIQVQDCEWEIDSKNMVWSTIYFEGRFCGITSNPYFFDKNKSKTGRYIFDAGTGILEIKLSDREIKEENFQGNVDSIDGDKMMISGIYKNNIMALKLKRVEISENR